MKLENIHSVVPTVGEQQQQQQKIKAKLSNFNSNKAMLTVKMASSEIKRHPASLFNSDHTVKATV